VSEPRISAGELARLADLAYLRIDADERPELARDLERILAYVESLAELGPYPEADGSGWFDSDVHREDRSCEGLDRREALGNAPAHDAAHFSVPPRKAPEAS